MLSQQQNPPEVSLSLQQQMNPNHDCIQTDIKSFSIRKYALASRQKDIFCSWPFPEKYLKICFKHGISNVLPPLEPGDSVIQSLRRDVMFKSSKQDNKKADSIDNKAPDFAEQEKLIKDECDSYSNEAISKVSSQECPLFPSSNSDKLEENNSNIASDFMVPRFKPSTTMHSLHHHDDQNGKLQISSKRMRHKRKRHKGKHKKRSMVDILAVAKHCSSEELYRINQILGCASEKAPKHGGEGNGGMANIENNCESELTDDCLDKKLQKDDFAAKKINMLSKKRWLVKFKFSGSKSNS
ncbi:uncharacterized protein LOC115994009 isoform X2 [Quercus lobata]|uniref:Uncharacterized protein n=1 Tax=Quercus lobata TaxID=97700 RepID=A0A7N2LXV2_QUELO|nr:uncharacterized protein LOC115994009 isoform X2 [Quercus lobata]